MMIHFTTNSIVFFVISCNGEGNTTKYPSIVEFLIETNKNFDSLYLLYFKILLWIKI